MFLRLVYNGDVGTWCTAVSVWGSAGRLRSRQWTWTSFLKSDTRSFLEKLRLREEVPLAFIFVFQEVILWAPSWVEQGVVSFCDYRELCLTLKQLALAEKGTMRTLTSTVILVLVLFNRVYLHEVELRLVCWREAWSRAKMVKDSADQGIGYIPLMSINVFVDTELP